jgi:hypothetical protein
MEKRRTHRFKLQLPLSITRFGAERVRLAGLTNNISSSGVVFTTETPPDLGGAIEYVINLNHEGPLAVSIRCMGKVLRANPIMAGEDTSHGNFQIAATLERYEFVREHVAAQG